MIPFPIYGRTLKTGSQHSAGDLGLCFDILGAVERSLLLHTLPQCAALERLGEMLLGTVMRMVDGYEFQSLHPAVRLYVHHDIVHFIGPEPLQRIVLEGTIDTGNGYPNLGKFKVVYEGTHRWFNRVLCIRADDSRLWVYEPPFADVKNVTGFNTFKGESAERQEGN